MLIAALLINWSVAVLPQELYTGRFFGGAERGHGRRKRLQFGNGSGGASTVRSGGNSTGKRQGWLRWNVRISFLMAGSTG
jgi:hypothetical protein